MKHEKSDRDGRRNTNSTTKTGVWIGRLRNNVCMGVCLRTFYIVVRKRGCVKRWRITAHDHPCQWSKCPQPSTTYHIHTCKRTVLPVMSGPEQTFFFLLAAKLGTQGLRHFPIHSAPESLVFGIMPTWPKDYVADLRSHKHMSLERSPWSKRSRAHQIWVVLLNAIKHWSIYAATVKLHHFGLVKPLGTLWTADVCVKGLGAIRVWHLSAIPNRDIDGYVYSVQRWALTRCCAVIISLRQQKHVAMSTAPARSNVFTMKQASSTPCPAPVRMFFSRTIRSWWYDRRRDGQLCPTCEETHLHYHRGANSPPIFVFSSMFDLIIEAAQWSAPE